MKTMKEAVCILVLAWVLSSFIEQIGTGVFLSSFIGKQVAIYWLPALIFLLSCCISFTTGSSWAAFGIMIPITTNLILNTPDTSFLLPTMAAAISGAVFGDHCSPISDTTVLSAIGAGCNHMDHVITQLPYSLLCGLIALCGYIALGYTESYWLGGLATLLCFVVVIKVFFLMRYYSSRKAQ